MGWIRGEVSFLQQYNTVLVLVLYNTVDLMSSINQRDRRASQDEPCIMEENLGS
jgi:hypothetical protein